jgi:hypothetical protein
MVDTSPNRSNKIKIPRSNPPGSKILIRWIFGGLTVWGIAQAIGAYSLNHDPRRPLIVIGCMAAFLGFWLVLLASWQKRHRQNSSQADE